MRRCWRRRSSNRSSRRRAAGTDFGGVVAALAGDDHVHALELVQVLASFRAGAVCRQSSAPCAAGLEVVKYTGSMCKIVFFDHALHQHRADHAAPTNQTYFNMMISTFFVVHSGIRPQAAKWGCCLALYCAGNQAVSA